MKWVLYSCVCVWTNCVCAQWAQKSKKVQYPFFRQTDFHEISGKRPPLFWIMNTSVKSSSDLDYNLCLSKVRSLQIYIYLCILLDLHFFDIFETHCVVVDSSKPHFCIVALGNHIWSASLNTISFLLQSSRTVVGLYREYWLTHGRG